jgi:hypothetical protein
VLFQTVRVPFVRFLGRIVRGWMSVSRFPLIPNQARDDDCFNKIPVTSHAPTSFALKARSSLPPTAWERKASSAAGGRTSTSSAGSRFSLKVSIPIMNHPLKILDITMFALSHCRDYLAGLSAWAEICDTGVFLPLADP